MSIKPILVAAVLAFTLPSLAGDTFHGLFDEYHQLQTALAGDDFAAAKNAAKHLNQAAGEVHVDHLSPPLKTAWKDQAEHLRAALTKAGQADNIGVLRQHFEHISMAVITLSKVAKPEGLREYRCPMAFDNKGANWLQREDSVRNPYFGSAMLACGFQVRDESADRAGTSHRHDQP